MKPVLLVPTMQLCCAALQCMSQLVPHYRYRSRAGLDSWQLPLSLLCAPAVVLDIRQAGPVSACSPQLLRCLAVRG